MLLFLCAKRAGKKEFEKYSKMVGKVVDDWQISCEI